MENQTVCWFHLLDILEIPVLSNGQTDVLCPLVIAIGTMGVSRVGIESGLPGFYGK